MNKVLFAVLFSVLLLVPIGVQQVFAAQVQINAQKDNFMISTAPTTNFGSSPVMTAVHSATSEERTLVSFDLSSIPIGSTVTSVEVEMMSLGANGAIVTLHKVTNNWGEFEASWNNRFIVIPTPWATAGGDFVSTSSDSKTITGTGPKTFGSTIGMVQDVQSWVDSSSTNFGWLLKTNTIPSAAVFATKENTGQPSAIITVTFTPPGGEPEICDDLIDNDGDSFIDEADPDCQTSPQMIGGEIIPIESTSLILAGAQTFSWMIPVIVSVLGIGLFVASRKSE